MEKGKEGEKGGEEGQTQPHCSSRALQGRAACLRVSPSRDGFCGDGEGTGGSKSSWRSISSRRYFHPRGKARKYCSQAGWTVAEESITSLGRSLIFKPSRCAVTLPAIPNECANPAISATAEWGFVTRLLVHVLPRSFPPGNPVPRSQFALPGTRGDVIRAGAARDLVAEQWGGMARGREPPWAQHRALPAAPSPAGKSQFEELGTFKSAP